MPAFNAWDIVKVPFPYTDRPVRQRRPALVVAANDIQRCHGLLWVLMITSAENRSWPGDVEIIDLLGAGLPAPSVVRTAKIAVIEAKDAERIGRLESESQMRVRQMVTAELAL
ncbi:type II toxin-antitoxin system PemK/MazF family toxin [Magnetospirillum moscoviense]|uniref:Growth inhibitor PemK n=1 Tax=Magnetospirillum moscoviense TaxID=1437059 RepID=A0A178MT50_9PROT|nr:type II toxin-antitoxin system PemK/MazF family toxin [Magnetospirillum moscoviense]OAN52452.1 growth inhibitor PemK [Magnetospirillum moscoviense]